MAKYYNALDKTTRSFIKKQKMFFTATAPHQGRINLSPKGSDSFRIIDDNCVAYQDLTGSGNETAAHISENKRITLMFCSFEGPPLILRLYGEGSAIKPRDPQWQELSRLFNDIIGVRQIMKIDVHSVQTSCGYAVPFYDYQGERETYPRWASKKGEQGIRQYWQDNNQRSIDDLPTYLLEDKELED